MVKFDIFVESIVTKNYNRTISWNRRWRLDCHLLVKQSNGIGYSQGITQEQLAEGICSSAYLSKLENNQISFNKEIVSQLCERLELPVEKFIAPSDEHVKKTLENWIDALHHYDLKKADAYYHEIQSLDEKR